MPLIIHDDQSVNLGAQEQNQSKNNIGTAHFVDFEPEAQEEGFSLPGFAGKAAIEVESRLAGLPAAAINLPPTLINIASELLPGIPESGREWIHKNIPANLFTKKISEATGTEELPSSGAARELFTKGAEKYTGQGSLQRQPGSYEDMALNFLGSVVDFLALGASGVKQAAQLTIAGGAAEKVFGKAGEVIGRRLGGEKEAERNKLRGEILGFFAGTNMLEAAQGKLTQFRAGQNIVEKFPQLEKETWDLVRGGSRGKDYSGLELQKSIHGAKKEIARLNPGEAKKAAEGSLNSIEKIIDDQKKLQRGKRVVSSGKEAIEESKLVPRQPMGKEAKEVEQLREQQRVAGQPLKAKPEKIELKQGNIPIDHVLDKIQENNVTIFDPSTPKDVADALKTVNRHLDSYVAPFMEKNPEIGKNYTLGKELTRAKYDMKDADAFLKKHSGKVAKFIDNPIAHALLFSGVPGAIFGGLISGKYVPTIAAATTAVGGAYVANSVNKLQALINKSPALKRNYEELIQSMQTHKVGNFQKAAVKLNKQLNQLTKKQPEGLVIHQ